jgi:hypothetical protein
VRVQSFGAANELESGTTIDVATVESAVDIKRSPPASA